MKNRPNVFLLFSNLKRTYLILMLIFLLFSNIGCFHIEPIHKQVIKDAESLEPLKDTVVLLELDYTCFLPPNPAGPNSVDLGIEETLTDSNGTFRLPLKFYFLSPLLCSTDKQFTYFKPGYFPSHSPDGVVLYKMNYYLNYLPYKESDRYLLSSELKEGSKYFKAGNSLVLFEDILHRQILNDKK